ncbi:MAG TPA: cytochrome B [Bdellovibrionales bacterium]|nr:cytochrome B [Bdellovibrionales bacterium]
MDLFGTVRRWFKGQPLRLPHHGPDAHQTVQRFDIHQRLQHGLMALSFTLLVLTGWPLAQTKVSTSQTWVKLFGGIDGAGLVHRMAAVILILASLYHLIYLIMLGGKRKLRLSMLPMPKDVMDAFQNILYFLGLRNEPPKFGRFSYIEKFDYWAVFWGMFIMAGSGFLRWFPETATKYLPAWVYEIGLHAHTDEALLAAMAIFLWHFYNVHLRPAVFPMSRVFLHGQLTVTELKHEHPLEYEELVRQGKIRE